MPGMYVHCRHLWGIACDARDRAISEAAANPESWTSDTTVSIVLAAAVAEAFINELPEMVAMERDVSGRAPESLSSALHAFANAHAEVERSRGSVTLKYLIAAQTLSGTMFDKGANPFQDFVLLLSLRNDLMHLKPRDEFTEAQDGTPTVKWPKYVASLQQRGLARVPDGNVIMSWFNTVQTPAMAMWACETAKEIILSVLKLIPDDPIPGKDPSSMFKKMFR